MRRSKRFVILTLAVAAGVQTANAQQGFTDTFPPEEFAARRAKVVAEIGDGVAIMQGTAERRGESPLRQSNQFFYLTGVTEPRAFLIVDGRTKKSTLYIAPSTPQRERAIGPYLGVNDASRKLTGIDVIAPRDSFTAAVTRIAADKRIIFLPMRPEVLGSESAGDVQTCFRTTKNDPWDGHTDRDETFIAKIK